MGAGHGASVLELVAAIRTATGRDLPDELSPRRLGDPGMLAARGGLAGGWVLGSDPALTLIETIIEHAVRRPHKG